MLGIEMQGKRCLSTRKARGTHTARETKGTAAAHSCLSLSLLPVTCAAATRVLTGWRPPMSSSSATSLEPLGKRRCAASSPNSVECPTSASSAAARFVRQFAGPRASAACLSFSVVTDWSPEERRLRSLPGSRRREDRSRCDGQVPDVWEIDAM